jgi:tetratricopeptide (TPR) repeat protein
MVRIPPIGECADGPQEPREKALVERVQADPTSLNAWFELGQYYEDGMQFVYAANAYEHGAALVKSERETGGHYVLARVYFRLQEWDLATRHLDEIFRVEPPDREAACRNPHFREAHYLRGAHSWLRKQWREAKKDFLRFIEIGGDENRVEEWLEEIQAQGE